MTLGVTKSAASPRLRKAPAARSRRRCRSRPAGETCCCRCRCRRRRAPVPAARCDAPAEPAERVALVRPARQDVEIAQTGVDDVDLAGRPLRADGCNSSICARSARCEIPARFIGMEKFRRLPLHAGRRAARSPPPWADPSLRQTARRIRVVPPAVGRRRIRCLLHRSRIGVGEFASADQSVYHSTMSAVINQQRAFFAFDFFPVSLNRCVDSGLPNSVPSRSLEKETNGRRRVA